MNRIEEICGRTEITQRIKEMKSGKMTQSILDKEYLLSEIDYLTAKRSQYRHLDQQGELRTAYDEKHSPYYVEAEGSEAVHIIELLKAEADGLLVKLPCPIGTKIYYVMRKAETKIPFVEWGIFCYSDIPSVIAGWGKTVFLTEQEARDVMGHG